MGKLDFAITSTNEEAKKYFLQGYGQVHGFWYYEAERSFRQAAALDPNCAMAYWGMAMSNMENAKRGRAFIAEAVQRQAGCTEREKQYIRALENFFASKAKDNEKRTALVAAWEGIVRKYPADVEAKAMLAWQLYDNNQNGQPLQSRLAFNALLSEILLASPLHPVHHYRIHTTTAGDDGNTALQSAAKCGPAAPGIPHMWHMPGHTYAEANRHADAAYQQEAALRIEHRHFTAMQMMSNENFLYQHNRSWLIDSLNHTGRVAEAIDLARHTIELPRAQGRTPQEGRRKLLGLLMQHQRWAELTEACGSELLQFEGDADRPQLLMAQVLAHRATGKPDVAETALNKLYSGLEAALAAKAEATAKARSDGRTAAKLDSDIALAVRDAEKPKQEAVRRWEKAIEEVHAHHAAGLKHWHRTLVHAKNAALSGLNLAQLALRAGQPAAALEHSASGDTVLSLATHVEVLHAAGKTAELPAALQKLRTVAGRADLDLPCLVRLQPLLAKQGWPSDWRLDIPATDIGERPALATLGSFRLQSWQAPAWNLPALDGKPVSLSQYAGKPVLLVCFLGVGCLHCAEQLQAFNPLKSKFDGLGISIVGVSTDELTKLQKASAEGQPAVKFPFPVLADPTLGVFRAYRAHDDFEGKPLHGVFLLDGQHRVRWQDVGSEPFMKLDFLHTEAGRLLNIPNSRITDETLASVTAVKR